MPIGTLSITKSAIWHIWQRVIWHLLCYVPFGTLHRMDFLHETLLRVEEYAKKAGSTPSNVCRAATGNPRLYERLKSRLEYQKEVVALINEHMAKNPLEPRNGGDG